MTHEQLERAARRLCELRGIVADVPVAHRAEPDASGFVPDIRLWSPAWRLAALEIVAAEQVREAIAFAEGGK